MSSKNIFKLTSIILGICFSLATNCLAETDLILVKDINQNPRALDIADRCSTPNFEVVFASDRLRGYEVWLGDGVSKPAVLLKDINPGAANSYGFNKCVALGNTVFFSASDGTSGNELWKTDGTAVGTVLVKDIEVGNSSSSPEDFIALNNKVFFSAFTSAAGRELWASDGTESGTVLVEDFWPGNSGGFYDEPKANSTRIFFQCANPTIGTELCSYNAVAGGPITGIDIYAGNSASSPRLMGVINEKMILNAQVNATGRELYSSDGSQVGTSIIKDIYPGATSGVPSGYESTFTLFNGKIYFEGSDGVLGNEVYVTDGTLAGTNLLKDVNTGNEASDPTSFVVSNNKVAFIATTATNGEEPWITDGTTLGTQLLADVEPGMGSSSYFDTIEPLKGSDKLIYAADTLAQGFEYWGINSTSATAAPLINFLPGNVSGYYNASTRTYSNELEIREPSPLPSVESDIVYLSDGTPAGTRPHPGALPSYNASSFSLPIAEMGGNLYFAANDGRSGFELWKTDGTASGTSLVKEINAGASWSVMTFNGGAVINGNTLLFSAVTEANGIELWKSDGTSVGTVMVKDINPGAGSGMDTDRSKIISAGSYALFAANNGTNGFELWRTDGTAVGTVMVQDIQPGADSGYYSSSQAIFFNPTPSTEIYLFAADNGVNGYELFSYDGTTVNLLEINSGAIGSNPSNFTVWSDPQFLTGITPYKGVLFSASTTAEGNEPYFYFPSLSSAGLLRDVIPGATGSNPHDFLTQNPTGTNYQIYFSASTLAAGEEILKYTQDGGGSVTVVKDIVVGGNSSYPRELKAFNSSTFVFGAFDSAGDRYNFYKSDGTSVGTVMLTNITDSNAYVPISGIKIKDGIAYFGAYNEVSKSYSPFKSDGTALGTKPLTSQGSFDNYELINATSYSALNQIFLTLYSTTYGAELFTIGEDQCPSDSTKSFAGICGCGVPDTDTDGDGTADCQDSCGSDSYKAAPGICGCGVADSGDSDSDGTLNCVDQCSADPSKTSPGVCGCGVSDADSNNNSVADCKDVSDTPNLTPAKAKLKAEKRRKKLTGKVIATFEARSGASYVVQYREVSAKRKRGEKLPKFRTKNVAAGKKLSLKAPQKGKVLELKYKFKIVVGSANYLSKESALTKYKTK